MRFLFFFIVLISFLTPNHSQNILAKEKKAPLPSLLPRNLQPPLPANLFVELAKLVNPAVVNIWTKGKREERRKRRRKNNSPSQDPFLDLFERFMEQMPQQGPSPSQDALGTGFVIRKDGLIITNNHVIQGAGQIKVQFDQKGARSFDAEVIGRDSRTDIALIRIKKNKSYPKVYPTIQLGNSDQVEVGQWVAAFGNPLGLGHTMTKGIISAKGREISELNRFPFLQTDASINPGNSGGPLVDTKGYVIGVNTAIAQGNGIGFAIPVNDVKLIVRKLEKSGKVVRGFIGVSFNELNEQAMKYFKLKEKKGVLVASVSPGGPADRAGIQSGDILLQFENKILYSSQDLVNSVANSDTGTKKTFTVLRDGKRKKISVRIGVHPEDRTLKSAGNRQRSKDSSPSKSYRGQKAPFELGFQIESYSENLAQQLSISSQLQKPIVVKVQKNSPADKADLQVGDLIVGVNQKNVRSAKDVIRRLINGPNALIVRRNGAQVFIFIEP